MKRKLSKMDITKITKIPYKKAKEILKKQQPLTLENVTLPHSAYPHMNNLEADVYTNEAFKNFQQFANFKDMGNIVFYKSKNGKQLEVCFGKAGEVVGVESGHGGVDDVGQETEPENKNPGGDFQPGDDNKKPITPESKKTHQTKEERIKKTYENKTTFEKRIEKIKKGFDVKDKAVDTYTKLARKTKSLKHPAKLIDTIKGYYSKFKSAKNKFNFFQKYKDEWEKVKKAYNVKATLADLLEDLI